MVSCALEFHCLFLIFKIFQPPLKSFSHWVPGSECFWLTLRIIPTTITFIRMRYWPASLTQQHHLSPDLWFSLFSATWHTLPVRKLKTLPLKVLDLCSMFTLVCQINTFLNDQDLICRTIYSRHCHNARFSFLGFNFLYDAFNPWPR